MTRMLLTVMIVCVWLIASAVFGADLNGFFTPHGFKAPLMQKGQHTFSLSYGHQRYDYRKDYREDLIVFETTEEVGYLSLSAAYSPVSGMVFDTRLDLFPGQGTGVHKFTTGVDEFGIKFHRDFTVSPTLQLAFRPRSNVELHGSLRFFEYKQEMTGHVWPGERQSGNQNLSFELGLAVLGNARVHDSDSVSCANTFSFLTPYGFQAPLLKEGQYSLIPRFRWNRVKTGGYYGDIEKMYYLSIDGVYALDEMLILKSTLDLYPRQTRVKQSLLYEYHSQDRENPQPPYYEPKYISWRSRFSASPSITACARPTGYAEFYGAFRYLRDKLVPNRRRQGEPAAERFRTYDIDFGFTLLRGMAPGDRVGVSRSASSDFLTPYGFKAPLVKKGQYVISFSSRFQRIEHNRDYPNVAFDREVSRVYIHTLRALYAPVNGLVLHASLSLCPSQERLIHRFILDADTTEWRLQEWSETGLFPRFDISLRPRSNLELSCSVYSAKEDRHSEQGYVYFPEDATRLEKDVRNKELRVQLGVTVLGILR